MAWHLKKIFVALVLANCINCNYVYGDVFTTGDVFVALQSGRIQWRDANGALKQTINTGVFGSQTGMVFDRADNLYVTNFNDTSISKIAPDGTVLAPFVSNTSPQLLPESIVFDAHGNAYVGGPNGPLIKYDSNGNLLQTFNVAVERTNGPDWIELAADERTMLYTSEGLHVKQYDVLNDQQLPDFVDISNEVLVPPDDLLRAFALRLLWPSGDLLLVDAAEILRFDVAGNVVQRYDVPTETWWFSLALDPDASSFWAAGLFSGRVSKFDIATGTELLSFNTGEVIGGLAVFGDSRQW